MKDQEDTSSFVPFRSTHEDGGGVAFGESFSAEELAVAKTVKALCDPDHLELTPTNAEFVIAYILRRYGLYAALMQRLKHEDGGELSDDKLRGIVEQTGKDYHASCN